MDGGAEVSTSAAKLILLDRVPMSGHSLAPPGAVSHPPSTTGRSLGSGSCSALSLSMECVA